MIERSDFPDESGMNRSGDYPPRRIGNDYLRADRYSNDIDRHERRYGENNDNEYRYKSQLKPNGSSNSSHFNSDKKNAKSLFSGSERASLDNRNPLVPENTFDPDGSKLREFVLRANFEKRSCQNTPDALKQSEDLPVADEYRRLRSSVEYDKAALDAWNWFERAQFQDCEAFALFKTLADINETLEGLYEFAFECDLAFGTGPEEILIALAMRVRYANVIRQHGKKPDRFQWVQSTMNRFDFWAITVLLKTPNEIAPNFVDTYDASGKLARFTLATQAMSSFAIDL